MKFAGFLTHHRCHPSHWALWISLDIFSIGATFASPFPASWPRCSPQVPGTPLHPPQLAQHLPWSGRLRSFTFRLLHDLTIFHHLGVPTISCEDTDIDVVGCCSMLLAQSLKKIETTLKLLRWKELSSVQVVQCFRQLVEGVRHNDASFLPDLADLADLAPASLHN